MTPSLPTVTSAELFKVRSVRSTRWALPLGAVAVVSATVVLAALTIRRTGVWEPRAIALPLEYFAYLTMTVGAMSATAEFSAGTAAVSASLVPNRRRWAAGKLLAAGILGVLSAAVVAVVLVVAEWVAGGQFGPAPTVAAIVGSGVLASGVSAVLGAATGMLLRSTAATLTLLLFWSFLVETVLVYVIPAGVGAFLPFKTIGGSRILLDRLGPWTGLAVFAAYTVVLTGSMMFAERRRDLVVDAG